MLPQIEILNVVTLFKMSGMLSRVGALLDKVIL